MDRKQQAITALTEMIAKFPDHPKAKDAQNLIAELQK
jgi:outer membrane protein assembly factor BamD (BamD/ComL family)